MVLCAELRLLLAPKYREAQMCIGTTSGSLPIVYAHNSALLPGSFDEHCLAVSAVCVLTGLGAIHIQQP